MSQFSSCKSLKPTARWWFSSTEESLYIRANSESKGKKARVRCRTGHLFSYSTCHKKIPLTFSCQANVQYNSLTGVDEKLIGNSRVIHIMDGTSEQGSKDFKIGKHGLEMKHRKTNTVS